MTSVFKGLSDPRIGNRPSGEGWEWGALMGELQQVRLAVAQATWKQVAAVRVGRFGRVLKAE